jgi:hypothetical protein
MQATRFFIFLATCASGWILPGCATTESTATATAVTPARITVLYDAFGKNAAMTKDWGYAVLVEIKGKRILFDTGDDRGFLPRMLRPRAWTSQSSTSWCYRTATAIMWVDCPIC